MRSKNKTFSLFLALIMVFCLMFSGNLPAYALDYTRVWIGGKEIKNNDVFGDGKVEYFETDTGSVYLNLNDYTYTGQGCDPENTQMFSAIACYRDATLVLVLSGKNQITLTGNHPQGAGIFARKNLVITGDGELVITGSQATNNSYGIYAGGKVMVEDECSIRATGEAAGNFSAGINAKAGFFIYGGTVIATSGSADKSYAIQNTGETTVLGKLTATSGTANDASIAIYSSNNITLEAGEINATGGKSNYGNSRGIYSDGNITLEEGTITAKADAANKDSGWSSGIFVGGKCVFNKGSITATAGTGKYSYGTVGKTSGAYLVNVGNNVDSFVASGETGAVRNDVNAAIAGNGWNNVSGTGSSTALAAKYYNESDLSAYKKLVFSKGAHSHSYGAWQTVKEATCSASGTKKRFCPCGDAQEQTIPMLSHTTSNWIIDQEPQIGIAGLKHKECTNCGKVLEIAIIDALNEPGKPAGDVNGDGAVDNKDLIALFRYLSGYSFEPALDADALDINNDGAVNNKDLIRLLKYLSGWDVRIY